MRRAAFLTGAAAIVAAAVAAQSGSAVRPQTRIYFASDRASVPGLFSIGRDGSGRRHLGQLPPGTFTSPVISPDRKRVVFVTDGALVISGVDGRGARLLATAGETPPA